MKPNSTSKDKYDTRRTVRLPAQLVEELEALAREAGVSLSSLIRSAVQAYLTKSQSEDEYEPISKKQVDDIGPVVWILSTLSERTPEALTRVLMWRSEDPDERHSLLNKAIKKLQETRPATWEWVEQQLTGP